MIQTIASLASDAWPTLSAVFNSSWRPTIKVQRSGRIDKVPATQQSIHTGRTLSNTSSIAQASSHHHGLNEVEYTVLPEIPRLLPVSPLLQSSSIVGSLQAPTARNILLACKSQIRIISSRFITHTTIVPSHSIPRHILASTTSPSFSRALSNLSSGPFRMHNFISRYNLSQQRSFWGNSKPTPGSPGNGSYSNLAHMESTANNNPRSATAQNAFYSALLRSNHPEIVIQRHESGNFATNAACEALYLRALDRVNGKGVVGQVSPQEAPNGLNVQHLQALSSPMGAQASQRAGFGGKIAPLHVVVEESRSSTWFRWLTTLAKFAFVIYMAQLLIVLFVDATGAFRRVGGGQPNEVKPELQKARFSDVHGCEEAKEELQEIVDFLKSPQKYGSLGGKLPKGVLLVGPPGTGKTLLARAVAGEAGVPFFYMSGSEFDEVFVGVGAKRVRDLFNAARAKAPAIVFIDELDAIGGKRNQKDAAYAKQTLNQLLTDLDGFNQTSGVIFLAATNFPELLDSALLRPGRFDRQVAVGLPDVRGRIAILNHYLKKMSISGGVDSSIIARGTPGFSGAELENLTNQAAVHASKRRATMIDMMDFEWAKDRILMGAERKSAVIQQKDKVMTAYHEGGHALVALFTPHADPLYKATIMPRGHALGITFQLPDMDKVSMAKQEYMAQIDVCMGGKVAEEMIYGADATTSGASSDIQQATRIAYNMVTRMGMSPLLGNVDLHSDYARLPTTTKQVIWEEVRRLVDEGRLRAEKLLYERRAELERLANALVEYETLGKDDIEKVIKGEKLSSILKANPIPSTGAPLPSLPELKLPLIPPPNPSSPAEQK